MAINMNDVLNGIWKNGLVPVVGAEQLPHAVSIAAAVRKAGLSCVEVPFQGAESLHAIRQLHAEFPDMLIGAGEVRTGEQADQAAAAGASFAASPGLDLSLAGHCRERGIPLIPEVSSASEAARAGELGLGAVRISQAGPLAGLPAFEEWAGSQNISVMVAGEQRPDRLRDYFAETRVLACAGAWLAPGELVQEGRFGEIAELVREALLAALDFRVKHIGVNNPDPQTALAGAGLFGRSFGLTVGEKENSVFASNAIELMKQPGRGDCGHIAVSASSVPRAIAYMERLGVGLDQSTARRDRQGSVNFIYLKEQICGFAVHLVDTVPDVV